jgi:hypothetical protein
LRFGVGVVFGSVVNRRSAWLVPTMAAFALAGCMTRPPVGAGLSCPVTVPQCHGPVYSVGGFNDDATLTTGSIGNAATAAVAPDAIVDASEEPMGLAVQTMPDRAGPTDESVAEIALGPALRLTPLTASDASELPAATGDPSELNQAPESALCRITDGQRR